MHFETTPQLTPEIAIGTEQFKEQSLNLLAQQLAVTKTPGYPAFEDRLRLPVVSYDCFQEAVLPLGKWCVDYPWMNREESIALHNTEVAFQSSGRPVHPWLDDMVTRSDIGIVMGKGFFREWGPNYTADPIVIRGNEILLIQRKDTGMWALPGGFLDTGESADIAARREAQEETGLIMPETTVGCITYAGPVADVRMTVNAWPETTAISYILPPDFDFEPIAQDDAQSAAWVPLHIAQSLPLYGSHSIFLRDQNFTEQLPALS